MENKGIIKIKSVLFIVRTLSIIKFNEIQGDCDKFALIPRLWHVYNIVLDPWCDLIQYQPDASVYMT